MNLRAVILLSASLNVAFVATLLWLPRPADAPLAGVAALTFIPVLTPAKTGIKRPRPVRPGTTYSQSLTQPAAPDEAFHWRQIESEDFRRYIANLRVIGCPEPTIRDLIIADVNKRYASRLRAVHQIDESRKYWQAEPRGSLRELERDQQMNAIRKEKRTLIKALLGIEYDEGDEWRTLNGGRSAHAVLSFLPPEKIASVRALEDKFNAVNDEFRGRVQSYWEPEDERDYLKLQLQQRAEMVKLLTPQELEEYELRSSDTASQMRYQSRDFALTEAEFRNAFRLRAEAERSGLLIQDPAGSPEENSRVAEANMQLQASLKAALGDARFTAYQRSQDSDFQQLSRASERYELPKETANQVWDMREAADRQARALDANQNLTQEQRQAALKAIQAETENSVKAVLGERAWKGYSPRSNGWLQRLGTLGSDP